MKLIEETIDRESDLPSEPMGEILNWSI